MLYFLQLTLKTHDQHAILYLLESHEILSSLQCRCFLKLINLFIYFMAKWAINPLTPNAGEKLLKFQENSPRVIISLILMTSGVE